MQQDVGKHATDDNIPPARREALERASALATETEAAEFLLQCEWPDARLKAAEHIHSRPLLEHVLGAVRNSDRRVEKLLQHRLDELARQEDAALRAQQALGHAQALVAASPLLVNQVAELDREWEQVGTPPADAAAAFLEQREALRQRLDAQTTLQRAVRQLGARLEQLAADATTNGELRSPEQVAQQLDQLESEMATLCASAEAPSLPRRLLGSFREHHAALRSALPLLEQRRAARAQREAQLADWESQDPASLQAPVLRQAWQELPALDAADSPALEARFADLLQKLAGGQRAQAEGENEKRREARQQFSQAMDALEAALKAGSLHDAVEAERKLREIDMARAHLRGDQKARMQNARSELGRLQGWAKWGGKMSREELLHTAQQLPGRQLPVAELAREVGSLREKWKALDATAGPATKEAWQQFDSACTTAYAPAAEHFHKLSQERQTNLERGQAIVKEVRERADELGRQVKPAAGSAPIQGADSEAIGATADPVAAPADTAPADTDRGPADWKAIAAFTDRVQQQWRQLGPIDRKPKKTLDKEYHEALSRLIKPLAAEQALEKQARAKLIEAAEAIDPAARQAPAQLQALQQEWQQRARRLPLNRHDEHALWQRFRNACDQLFAKRKQHVKTADAERTAHLREREALCEKLEAAAKETPEAIRTVLREVRSAWSRAGAVPRSAERQIETRYARAVAALQKRLDEGERGQRRQRAELLAGRFALCMQLEQAVLQQVDAAAAEQAWRDLPAAKTDVEQALARRAERALAARVSPDPALLRELKANQEALMHDLLRAEIQLGIDSPPAWARERLKVQVEVLQSSLKSGEKQLAPHALLLRLATLAAPMPAEEEPRLQAVIARLA